MTSEPCIVITGYTVTSKPHLWIYSKKAQSKPRSSRSLGEKVCQALAKDGESGVHSFARAGESRTEEVQALKFKA
jgi:hypothetical protein